MATALAYRTITGAFAAPAAVHSLLNVISPAGHGLTIVTFRVAFDGVTASAVPVFVELCQSTQGAAGTPGTSPTPVQVRGRATAGSAPTAGAAYTVEPTTLTAIDGWYVTPNGGVWEMPNALGREFEIDSSGGTNKGFVIRITPPATVNARAMIETENL